MRNFKLNQEEKVTYKEAKEVVSGTMAERDFNNLTESTITDSVKFETVQNCKYSVTKIGRKGSILYPGGEYETKAEVGIFELEVLYDYKHPANFSQNQNNISKIFKIAF